MNIPSIQSSCEQHRDILMKAIKVVTHEYIINPTSDENFVSFLRNANPEDVFYNCLQLPQKSLSYFLIIERSFVRKNGFNFLCDVIAHLCLSIIDPEHVIPYLLELFPPTVTTKLDVIDVLYMYDVLDNLRSMGFFGIYLNSASDQMIYALEKRKGSSLNFQIELTLPTNFFIMIKLLYNNLKFALQMCEYLAKCTRNNEILPFLLLYLSLLRFSVDSQKDFVPSRLVDFIFREPMAEIILSDIVMTLLFQCRGKQYLERLSCWDKFSENVWMIPQNMKWLYKAIPTKVLLLWEYLKDKGFYPELWPQILQHLCMKDLRIDILDKTVYMTCSQVS